MQACGNYQQVGTAVPFSANDLASCCFIIFTVLPLNTQTYVT
jgi:hypothetical protein